MRFGDAQKKKGQHEAGPENDRRGPVALLLVQTLVVGACRDIAGCLQSNIDDQLSFHART